MTDEQMYRTMLVAERDLRADAERLEKQARHARELAEAAHSIGGRALRRLGRVPA